MIRLYNEEDIEDIITLEKKILNTTLGDSLYIDLENPFPKAKMKNNWEKYSQSDPTFSRLSHTLSGDVAYETNMFGNSSRKSVDALKDDSKYGFYNEFKDLTIDGNSSILDVKINNSNLFSNTAGRLNFHHCKIGEYDSNICDTPMW